MRLGDAKADSVREALAKGAGCDFDSVCMTYFWVTRGQGVDLTEGFQVVERHDGEYQEANANHSQCFMQAQPLV